MPPPDLVALFVPAIEALGLRYMVTGAFAAIVYGEPRLTNDIDLIVEMLADDAERVHQAFASTEYYVAPVETIAAEAARPMHGHFNVIHHATALKADLYPAGDDPLHAWALPLRRSIEIDGVTVHIAPPEYVIVRKLQYLRDGGSDKHRRDIQAILALHGAALDNSALAEWVERLDLRNTWISVARSVEERS